MPERRDTLKIPEFRLITEIQQEDPNAASLVNLSHGGIYTLKPTDFKPLGPRMVQLDIPVPEASESIWALGQVVFDRVGNRNVGSGIRFVAMADRDWIFVRDLVELRRAQLMQQLNVGLKWRKELAAHPSPFTAPPPPADNWAKTYVW